MKAAGRKQEELLKKAGKAIEKEVTTTAACTEQQTSTEQHTAYVIKSLKPAGNNANSKVDKSATGVKAMEDQVGNLWFLKDVGQSYSIASTAGQLLSNKIIKHYLGKHAAHNQLYNDEHGQTWILSKEIPNFKTLTHMGHACDNKPIVGFEFLAMLKVFVANRNNEPNNYGVVVYPDKCVATQIDGDEAYQIAPYLMKTNFQKLDFNLQQNGASGDKVMFRCGNYAHTCSNDVTNLKGNDRINYKDMLKAIDTILSTDKNIFRNMVHDTVEELKAHYTQKQFEECYSFDKLNSFDELEPMYNAYVEANLALTKTLVHDTIAAELAKEAV